MMLSARNLNSRKGGSKYIFLSHLEVCVNIKVKHTALYLESA